MLSVIYCVYSTLKLGGCPWRLGTSCFPSIASRRWKTSPAISTIPVGRVTAFIDESYGAKPRIEYSRCGGAPGWNVKYKARGRALCTVYPRDGFFICMVSVGSKEKDEAEALLATADPYVRALYERSADSSMGRWLMMEVTSEDILRDAEALMLLRAAPKGARS